MNEWVEGLMEKGLRDVKPNHISWSHSIASNHPILTQPNPTQPSLEIRAQREGIIRSSSNSSNREPVKAVEATSSGTLRKGKLPHRHHHRHNPFSSLLCWVAWPSLSQLVFMSAQWEQASDTITSEWGSSRRDSLSLSLPAYYMRYIPTLSFFRFSSHADYERWKREWKLICSTTAISKGKQLKTVEEWRRERNEIMKRSRDRQGKKKM